jgi:DNA-binding GntR family transcriptional regulator
MNKLQLAEPLGGPSRGALRHEVVKRLLAEIFRGDLPAGTRLIVQKLAVRFGISSTPVREALVELESVGMVRFVHNRGAVVKPFGPAELREVFLIRRILETEAARAACGRIDPEALQQLRSEMAALVALGGASQWADREMAADRRFHRLIAYACGSPRLAEEIDRYNTMVQTVREIVGNRYSAQQRALEEHLAVIDALATGQAERAAAEMARHIDRTAEHVQATLFPHE